MLISQLISQGSLTSPIAAIIPTKVFSTKIFPSLKPLAILSIELLLALPLGFLLTHLWNGGIAWILGGIASGGLVLTIGRSLHHTAMKPNARARKLGQALVGLTIGFSIAHSNLTTIATDLPIFIALTIFLLLSGTVIGYLYSRLSRTNVLTSMLATVPGGVSIMSSLAAEYNRNIALVSLVQIIRVTAVIILIPLLARASTTLETIAAPLTSQPLISYQVVDWMGLSLALVLTGFSTALISWGKVPAAPFMGGIITGILFNPMLEALSVLPLSDFTPPRLVGLLGQTFLGITIGEYWGNKPRVERRAVGHAMLSVMMTLIAGFAATWIAMQLTDWDWLTCMLVTAPGGAPEMILVALSLDHHVELVTAGHLVRLIAINGSLPVWVLLFRVLDRQLAEPNSLV